MTLFRYYSARNLKDDSPERRECFYASSYNDTSKNDYLYWQMQGWEGYFGKLNPDMSMIIYDKLNYNILVYIIIWIHL